MKNLPKLKFKKPSKKSLRFIAPLAFVAALIVSVVVVQTVNLPKKADGAAGKPVSTADYQKSLKAQVDNADGSPASGRDPADQSQNSLSKAASTPSGTGLRTDKPAAGVTGGGTTSTPSQVYTPDQQKSGINDAGCFYDYGKPGQECVYAHLADANGKLNCPAVRMHFPSGVTVSGTDRFKLDTNGDKIACGTGDK